MKKKTSVAEAMIASIWVVDAHMLTAAIVNSTLIQVWQKVIIRKMVIHFALLVTAPGVTALIVQFLVNQDR